jgi:hypothetical protein
VGAAFLTGFFRVLLVRAAFLDPIEEIGWTMFWHRLAEGKTMRMEALFESTTFWKCVAGFLIAAVIGGIGSLRLNELLEQSSRSRKK